MSRERPVHSQFGMQARVGDALTTIQTDLSAEIVTRAWESGHTMSPDQIWAFISDESFVD